MGTLQQQLTQGLTVWKQSLLTSLVEYTLGPQADSNPWFSPVIHFSDVYCMKFRINQTSTPRRTDFLESFSYKHNLLILFSLHSPRHTVVLLPFLHCVISFHLYPNHIYIYPFSFEYNLPFILLSPISPSLILKDKE